MQKLGELKNEAGAPKMHQIQQQLRDIGHAYQSKNFPSSVHDYKPWQVKWGYE